MPKKRRKAMIAETTLDIPYQKVRVEWIDCVSDSGWATDKEFDKTSHVFVSYVHDSTVGSPFTDMEGDADSRHDSCRQHDVAFTESRRT